MFTVDIKGHLKSELTILTVKHWPGYYECIILTALHICVNPVCYCFSCMYCFCCYAVLFVVFYVVFWDPRKTSSRLGVS